MGLERVEDVSESPVGFLNQLSALVAVFLLTYLIQALKQCDEVGGGGWRGIGRKRERWRKPTGDSEALSLLNW